MIVIQELFNQIERLGYKFELVGDSIKFTYVKGNQTPREAVPILRQFKERKQEVIKYLESRNEKDLKAFLNSLSIEEQEFFEERAGIVEYDGGLPRDEAEQKASKLTSFFFQKSINRITNFYD